MTIGQREDNIREISCERHRDGARKKYKKPRFGRPDVPRPLAGLDMRSQPAKVFVARLNEVKAEYPDGEPSRLRELAGLRVASEQVSLEVLKGNGKRRDDRWRIANLIARRESELQGVSLRRRLGGEGYPSAS